MGNQISCFLCHRIREQKTILQEGLGDLDEKSIRQTAA